MSTILASPTRSLILGILIAIAILAAWIAVSGIDTHGFFSFALRWLHIVSAIIWLGMIWFVNFIQLVALAEIEPASRPVLMKHVVPRVAFTFRHASHLTVLTGVLLLLTTGYMLDRLVFAAEVFVPTARSALMWAGVIGALAMYMFVHMMIWPALRVVLGIEPGDEARIAAARARVAVYARWNLILSVPVTLAMVAAPHLY